MTSHVKISKHWNTGDSLSQYKYTASTGSIGILCSPGPSPRIAFVARRDAVVSMREGNTRCAQVSYREENSSASVLYLALASVVDALSR